MNKIKSAQRYTKITAIVLCCILCVGIMSGCVSNIEVPVVSGIVIGAADVKVSYEIGEEITYAGLKVQAKMSNDYYRDMKVNEYAVSTDYDSAAAGEYTVMIVSKDNASIKANYQVNVNKTSAVALAIKTAAKKQVYEIGEKIDYSGLELEKTTSTAVACLVTLDDCYISSDFDSSKAGVYKINIILKDNSAVKTLYTVTVLAATANRLILDTSNVQKDYAVGQELNYSGLIVNQSMSDGTNIALDEDEYYFNTDFKSTRGGIYTVTVIAKSDSMLFASYDVNVNTVAASLEITTHANKLTYKIRDNIDYSGLIISKIYDDGTKEPLADSEIAITTDYNKALGGEYTVSIKLVSDENVATSYKVTVDKELKSISVKSKPTKTIYQVGQELNLDGLIVQESFNDNSKENLTDDEYIVDKSKYIATKGGNYRINIALKADTTKTTYFNVTVEKLIVSCEYDGQSVPNKTIYDLNEDIKLADDLQGLKIVLTYNDGTTGDANRYAFKHTTDFVKGVAGTYTITVTFSTTGGFTAYEPVKDFVYSYTISVREPITKALRVAKYPTKMVYSIGENFAVDGLQVEKVLSDGSFIAITDSEYSISQEFDPTKAGVYLVKLALNANEEIVAEFSVTVNVAAPKASFVTTLADNATVLGSKSSFEVVALDDNGERLSGLKAVIDGNAKITDTYNDNDKISYTLELNNERQNYKIVFSVMDNAGNIVSKEMNITHPPVKNGDVIGQVIFSIDAYTIGHGYIVAPTVMNIYEGENSVYSLARLIRSNGYCFTYTGKINSGFYIQRIISGTTHEISNCACKELNATIPIVNPRNLLISVKPPQSIIDIAYDLDIDSYKQGSLGEFDLTPMSGWMYATNNVLPSVGFSDCFPMDGDVIRAQFTVAMGSDISTSWGGYFDEVSRDALTELFAQAFILTNEEKGAIAIEFNAALAAMAQFGISQSELNTAYNGLKFALDKINNAEAI